MTTKIRVYIKGGTMRFIYTDAARPLLSLGEASIRRASRVEPGDPAKGQDPLQWYANLAPVHGPVLGPFTERTLALTAEVQWLHQHHLRSA